MRDVPAGHPEKPQGIDGFKLLERMNGGSHKELALWGLSFLEIDPYAQILDIGCGGGANLERLLLKAYRGHVTGIDYSSVSVAASSSHNKDAILSGKCRVLEGNVTRMPFEDNAFDIVTAFETTYYWDLKTAFSEVARVLKPDGVFLICNEDDGSDPEIIELSSRIPGMVIHKPDTLLEQLEIAGFNGCTIHRIEEKGHIAIVAQIITSCDLGS